MKDTDNLGHYETPSRAENATTTDIYYNPEVMGTGQISDVDRMLDTDFSTRQEMNNQSFLYVLTRYFREAYTDTDGLRQNQAIMLEASNMIARLFEDYVDRITKNCDGTPRCNIQLIASWVDNTTKLIQKAYQQESIFSTDKAKDPRTGLSVGGMYDTGFMRGFLDDLVYDKYIQGAAVFFGSIDESLSKIILYNFWGNSYDDYYGQFVNMLALPPEKRAMVYQKANTAWLEDAISERYAMYEEQRLNDTHFGDTAKNEYRPEVDIPKLFNGLFADYIRRIRAISGYTKKADEAFLSWIYIFQSLVNKQYNAKLAVLEQSSYGQMDAIYACQDFYSFFCMPALFKILLNYLSDSEEIPIVDESTPDVQQHQAKVMEETDEVLERAEELRSNPKAPALPRIQKEQHDGSNVPHSPYKTCHLVFYDSVDEQKREILYKYMHDHVGHNPGVEEFLCIKALIDENYLKYPDFVKFAAEFPAYQDKGRNFSNYFGSRGKLKEELSDKHQLIVDAFVTEINALLYPEKKIL